jgi:hypothetical protein
MSEWPMRGHFRYLRFKTFPMTPRTPQCEVFWAFLLSSKHSGVPEDSKPPTFPNVGLHPHTWPKWGCDIRINYIYNYKFHRLKCRLKITWLDLCCCVWRIRVVPYIMGKFHWCWITWWWVVFRHNNNLRH